MAERKKNTTKNSDKTQTKVNKAVKKQVKKAAKKPYFKYVILTVVIILITLVLLYVFVPTIKAFVNKIIFGEDPIAGSSNKIVRYDDDVTLTELTDLKIHMVDVGQGDSIILELPDGLNVIIDAGTSGSYSKLKTYIESLNIKTFHYLIATHSDSDHIGGMEKLFNDYEIVNVLRPMQNYSGADFTFTQEFNPVVKKSGTQSSKTYGKFLNCIQNEQYTDGDGNRHYANWEFFNKDSDITRNLSYNGITYTYSFDFLTPIARVGEITSSDNNDFSPYVKFTYSVSGAKDDESRFDMLFTGDGEKEVITEFLDTYTDADFLNVDILKEGHHGSANAVSKGLIEKTKPEYSLISCGKGNTYKHPHQVVLNLLASYDCTFFRTDLNGSIVVSVSGNGSYDILPAIPSSNYSTEEFFTGGSSNQQIFDMAA